MTILVTGSTGNIGSQVVAGLAGKGVDVRALTRSPEKARFPEGIVPVGGELSDIDAMRGALQGASTLFLLAPNVPDELTQALLALNLAREAGLRRVVYLSVFKGGEYSDVPHFTGKFAVERMIEQCGIPATILRPAYYIQNDLRQKDALLGAGVYAMPVGQKGISMVDTRDIAEAAVAELLRRARATDALPGEIVPLVGPDALTGPALAGLWSEVLGKPIRYAGDDLDVMEQRMKGAGPAWLAYDMRLMMQRYQQDGAVAAPADLDRLTHLLGRAPRSYRDFAREAASQWQAG
jgi:uncharacterized protein YbjT (DUF2867 family)